MKLEKLSIGYGRQVVAKDLTAVLPAGTLTALVGSNGSGKSTLLRTVAGLQPSLGGTISPAKPGPKEVAVVLTDRIDAPALTVEEIVGLGRIPHTPLSGHMTKADRDIIDRSLALCDITSLRKKSIRETSDGERQRAMIARAIAQDTPLILLDEPTAFLDFPAKVEILQLLLRLCREEGKTILLSTHDLEITFQIVDRLWLIGKEGLQEGTPQELAESGAIAKLFPHLPFDAQDLRFHFQQQ